MSQDTPKTKRLFVGGLFDEVTPEDLKQRFAKYGIVKSVDLKAKKNDFGDIVKTFAFIDFDSTPAKLKQCIDVFNRAKWKGKELKIQLAESSFLDKLAKERQMQSVVKLWSPDPSRTRDSEEQHRAIQQLKVKGPPGTAIEGKEGWVIGKYSQPVPVLRVKRDNGKQTVIFDPSKNCHGLKRFDKDDDVPTVSLDQLTWQLEEKRMPPKVAVPKPLKRKNIEVAKKKMSDDSDSSSGSESEFNKTAETSFVDLSASQMDDSDNESRGSCDTDEIVRRAKSGKFSHKNDTKQEVQNSFQISNAKSVRKAKIQSCMTHPLDIVAKELVFSEFSDGVSSCADAENELESENESIEDVFDLLKSGKIEKLSSTSQNHRLKSKKENVTIINVIPELTEPLSRKRKKCHQSESPTLLITESSASAESNEVPKKRKITKSALESKIPSASSPAKMPLETEVESISASVILEKSNRRKLNQLASENKLPSPHLTEPLENLGLSSSNTSATAEKSKKRKRSEFAEEENQASKIDKLEIVQATSHSLKTLKHDETKEVVKPTQSKKPRVQDTKDLESNTEAVETKVSKDVPVKKVPVSEQKKSLEILQSVLPIKTGQTMGFRDFQSFRYDPSAADHGKFEIHDGHQESQQPVQVKKGETEIPCTEVKRFAEVDASVVDVFKAQPADAPFSLGALFGPEESSDDEAESQPVLPNWKKKPKVVADNEHDERYESNAESKSGSTKNIEDGFFYHSDDPRLKAFRFCREKDLEELRVEWQEKRPYLVESYRMKKKKPLRSHEKVTRSNGKPHGKPTFYKGKPTIPRGNVFKNRSHVAH